VCDSSFLNVEDGDTVCPAMIDLMYPPVFETVTRDMLTKDRVCDEFLGFCSSPKVTVHELEDF
jgi:hypothetical protein